MKIREELAPPEIEQFLVIYGKPHKAASGDKISRWIKNTIFSVGFDIDVSEAHSIRSTSSSKVKQVGIP